MTDFDRSLILIVGAQRSGTTWVQRLLASHPAIAGGQESHLFSGYLGALWQRWQDEQSHRTAGGRTIGLGCYLTEDELLEEMRGLAERILGRVRQSKPGATFIVEKTPDHGMHLPLIHKLFPDATVIHVLRDGRDVVDSMLAAAGTSWGHTWTAATAAEAAYRWRHWVRTIQCDLRLFRRHCEIRYEDLISNGNAALAGLFDFLGLPSANVASILERWNFAACKINSPEDSLIVHDRMRGGKLEPNGFHRSGRAGAWREALTPEQQQAVLDQAGSLLQELGYTEASPATPAPAPAPHEMVSLTSRADLLWRIPKNIEVIQSTNAQMLPRERLYLYSTVLALAPERCLEIGVCEGGSTRLVHAALGDLGRGTLVSVDPCLQISQELKDTLSNRVTFIKGSSPQVLTEAKDRAGGSFDFVLVDGDHTYRGVREDLRGVVEVCRPGAVILAHDAYFQEVSAAIDDALRSRLPLADAGIMSTTCHPMRQNGRVSHWGGFRLLVRTDITSKSGTAGLVRRLGKKLASFLRPKLAPR